MRTSDREWHKAKRSEAKAKDLKELRVWLSPSTLQRLDALVRREGRSRAEVLSLLIFTAEANR